MAKFAWWKGQGTEPPAAYQSESWNVNPALRKGKLSREHKEFVSDLDKHMKPYSKDLTLYRAQPRDTLGGKAEKSYVSAHEDPQVAYDYLPADPNSAPKGTIYKINVAKGTKGTSMKPYRGVMDPREHILARNTRFERGKESAHPTNPNVKIVELKAKN